MNNDFLEFIVSENMNKTENQRNEILKPIKEDLTYFVNNLAMLNDRMKLIIETLGDLEFVLGSSPDAATDSLDSIFMPLSWLRLIRNKAIQLHASMDRFDCSAKEHCVG